MTERAAVALPVDPKARKALPLVSGCLDYFPAALAAVAELSRIGNEQHNPGQPMHHARGKSTDHADCIVRHLMDRGVVDTDGVRHSTKVAWRALALLQEELEAAGAPLARGARLPASEADLSSVGSAGDEALEEALKNWPYHVAEKWCCSPEPGCALAFQCSRRPGHAGDHVGVSSDRQSTATVRRWPNEVSHG